MDKQTLENMTINAFENAKKERAELFTATEKAIYFNRKLEDDKDVLITSGKIDGKNAEIREAQLRDKLADQYNELAISQNVERAAKKNYDLAMFDVDTVKIMVRLMELP